MEAGKFIEVWRQRSDVALLPTSRLLLTDLRGRVAPEDVAKLVLAKLLFRPSPGKDEALALLRSVGGDSVFCGSGDCGRW